jgi:thymidine kinase
LAYAECRSFATTMSLQIILGPMFAGKSSAILRIVNRYKAIGWPMCCVTFAGDSRYSDEEFLMNHDAQSIPCKKVVSLLDEFLDTDEFEKAKLIIIDEAQFFPDLKSFVLGAVEDYQKDVVVVGLDGDADRNPFGQILDCIPLADEIHKLKAFCKMCKDGTEALFSYCQKQKTEQVCVGGAELYMPLCRKHYLNPGM